MADSVEIILWIDRRWKAAIEKQLKDETLQEHLEEVIDELCNQLPGREYARISHEIWQEDQANKQALEAARTWSAYRVVENGEEWHFKSTPGEELLNTAKKLRDYLKGDSSDGKFIRLFLHGTKISPAEYQDMMRLRMENTGKVTGVFDIDFDKQEFSAVHIMEGWKSWAMQDLSTAAYRAFRKGCISTEERYSILLDHLDGREITTAGHLSARNFTFGDEIIEDDGKLNFYVQAEFDVDAAFGTFVCTDKNDDWLNIYANYDMERGEVCDTLELTLCKGDGSEEAFSYHLNAAEQEVLLHRMDEFCQQQTGMSLHDYTKQLREEQTQTPEMQM